ncbi:hypothetical protein B4900_08050 [Yersinia rohdei]|nr:hypothetical protein B4900_08050 [Yersinia rohdei]
MNHNMMCAGEDRKKSKAPGLGAPAPEMASPWLRTNIMPTANINEAPCGLLSIWLSNCHYFISAPSLQARVLIRYLSIY